MNVVTLTLNPAIDKSCHVDGVIPEHKLRCSEPHYDPGGGGINVSRAMRQLGGQSLALWSCGGKTGELLGELLEREAVAQQAVPIEGWVRENLIVYEDSTQQQYRFGLPGPRLSQQDAGRWQEVVERLQPPPDYLVVSGSLPPGQDADFYARLIAPVAQSCRVVVDTSGEALRRSVEAGLFLIKPNLRELGQLVGRELQDDGQIEQAARRLIERGKVEVVVTSLGSGGAMVLTADYTAQLRSPTVPIRSKVGAGDSMVAGILTGLTRGWAVLEAARLGVAAGAAAVMTPGTSLCQRPDVERLYQHMQQEHARTAAKA